MSDLSNLPRRDPRGRLLEVPHWLRPGWKHVNAAGFGTGGPGRKACAREGCRGTAPRRSDYCWKHDVSRRHKRLDELRRGEGKPPTPAELVRLHRANMKRLWERAPWWPGSTIWFTPGLEANFAEDCRRSVLDLAETAPVVADTLRWGWRRSVLDHDDDPGWLRALVAARKRQARIGPAPEDYSYMPPPETPPDDLRIKQVHRRATAFELALQTSPVNRDRASKSKARRRRSRERQAPAQFDVPAFIAQHWQAVFRPLFKRLRLGDADVDAPIGARLVAAYHSVVVEQERLGGASGSAQRRWVELLRELTP